MTFLKNIILKLLFKKYGCLYRTKPQKFSNFSEDYLLSYKQCYGGFLYPNKEEIAPTVLVYIIKTIERFPLLTLRKNPKIGDYNLVFFMNISVITPFKM